MVKRMSRERATLLTSAVTAIAILGAVVTAQPSRTTPGDRLARLESDLRYQLELEARLDRAGFEARTAKLEDALEAWRQSPQSQRDYELITDWLRESIARSLPGETVEWSPTPDFGPPADNSSERRQARQHAKHSAAEEPPRAEQTGSQKPSPGSRDAVKGRTAQAAASVPANQASAPRRAESFIISVSEPLPIAFADAMSDEAARAHANRGLVAEQQPAPHVAGKPVAAAAPEEAEAPTRADITLSGAPVESAAERPAPSPAETAAAYSETDAANSHDNADAVAATPADALPIVGQAPPVAVNLSELNARIGGYHEELRDIDAGVIGGIRGTTIGKVTRLVERLEAVAGQYQFVRLYYESLSEDERHFVTPPRSMESTIAAVDQQRARLEAAAEDDHFTAADDAGVSVLERRLQKLRKIAGREL